MCFTIAGHMALGIAGQELVVRVEPDGYERALARAHAREMDLTGLALRGFMFVDPAGIRTKRSLTSWVAAAVVFVKSLPLNRAKSQRIRRQGKRATR